MAMSLSIEKRETWRFILRHGNYSLDTIPRQPKGLMAKQCEYGTFDHKTTNLVAYITFS